MHIADVTYFVPHKSALDTEAQVKATTFYLVDRRFDMLPSLLSSGECVPFILNRTTFPHYMFFSHFFLGFGYGLSPPQDLCSLHGSTDRLAVSTIWTMSSDFREIKSVWYGRTVIHNCQGKNDIIVRNVHISWAFSDTHDP